MSTPLALLLGWSLVPCARLTQCLVRTYGVELVVEFFLFPAPFYVRHGVSFNPVLWTRPCCVVLWEEFDKLAALAKAFANINVTAEALALNCFGIPLS